MTELLGRVIYGPVPSWRLGRSLGVDMVSCPAKTCSFDCTYCQLGRTRDHTRERREFVSLTRLVSEMEKLPPLEIDYVTFSGTAEPTLAANLGDAIAAVKDRLATPVAVLTNSSLLADPKVRQDLLQSDEVVAKLDAAREAMFQRVNRPVPGVTLNEIIEAIHVFRTEYQGKLALQMMFYETNRGEADRLAELARELGADEIEVNTPLRPCAVKPLSPEALAEVKRAFHGLPAISVYEASRPEVQPMDIDETLRRRPELEKAGHVRGRDSDRA